MTRLQKILIGMTLGALLTGAALFIFFKSKSAQTVFEGGGLEQKKTEEVQVEEKPETVKIEAEEKIDQKTEEKATLPEEKEVTQEDKKESISDEKEESKDMPPKSFAVKSALVSFGHESASNRKIDTVVLHSSYNPSGDPYSVSAVRSIWQSYGVAPHYMVARDGTVYQLVADKDIAYHAGESTMKDGRKNVNDFSIGVEILNTKDDEYTKAQYQAVKDLIAYLKGKHSIKYVVGHDDIAPGRKTDPWNFDWNKI